MVAVPVCFFFQWWIIIYLEIQVGPNQENRYSFSILKYFYNFIIIYIYFFNLFLFLAFNKYVIMSVSIRLCRL